MIFNPITLLLTFMMGFFIFALQSVIDFHFVDYDHIYMFGVSVGMSVLFWFLLILGDLSYYYEKHHKKNFESWMRKHNFKDKKV